MKISFGVLLVGSAILSLSNVSAQAADAAMGSLVYSKPSFDVNVGSVPGQVRSITGAWLRSGDAKIVDVMDEAGNSVPVHFFLKSSASSFLNDVQSGKSFDITDCAHAGSEPGISRPSGEYCVDRMIPAEFHCDLMDHATEIAASAIDPAQFTNPKEVTVYIPLHECRPTK